MGRIVWLNDPSVPGGYADRWEKPEDGTLFREIRLAAGTTAQEREAAQVLAWPERVLPPGGRDEYGTRRKQGVRTFTLWADPARTRLLAGVSTKSAAKGEIATYEVRGESGEPLAVITREPAVRGGRVRTRWTVQPTDGPAAVGLKGRAFWWGVWWLISPIQLVIAVGSVIAGSGDVARMPRRTKWRVADGDGGRIVMDWSSGAGDFELELFEDGWDARVGAALIALLGSYDSWLGHPWDNAAD